LPNCFLDGTNEFVVETKTSAQDGLDLLKDHSFDAIISDYQMPGMDGIAFLKAVREQFGDIPFILFTGRGREEVVIEAINNGADFYIQKGGDPEAQFAELAHKIRHAVRRKQAEKALIQSQGYLNQIFSSVKAGILIIDSANHEIVDINHAGADMIGLPREQILGNVCHKFICPAEAGQCPITNLHKSVDNSERILITSEGKRLPIIKYVTRVTLDGRECLLETFIDNSQRKQAEEVLIQKTEDLHVAYEAMTATEEELREQYDKLVIGEQNLRESETKYRDLAELLPQMVFETDLDLRITYANRHPLTVLGFTDKDLEHGINVLSLIDPSQHAHVRDSIQKSLNGISFEPQEYTALRKDGSSLPVIIYSAPLYRNKTLAGFRGVVIDISARKKMEDGLRESEEKFRSIVETSPDMIWEIDLQGKIGYISPMVTTITGYTPEELAGKPVTDLIPEPGKTFVMQDLARHLSSEGPFAPLEVPALHRNGQDLVIEIRPSRITDAGGTLKGFRGVARDITEHRKAEEALRESESKFRSIFENSPYPIAINSIPDNKFLQVNKAFLDISEYTEAEILGKDPIERGFLPLTEALKLISRRLLTGKIENVPLAVTAKDGKQVHVLFTTIPVTINNVPATVTVTAEVTKLKRVEEDLLQKNEDLNAAYEELTATDEELRQNYDELRKKEEMIRASEEKFRALVELSLDGIFITDFTGKLLFANRAAGLIIDTSDYEALIGKRNVMEFVAPESLADVLLDFSKVSQGIDAYLVHYRLITETKREVWVECIGKKIPFGDASAMLVSMRDITERKATELALQALVRGMVDTTGLDSLKKITETVSSWTGADCVMVGEIQPDGRTVKVLSMLLDGKEVYDFSYSLKGNPCENVAERGFCMFPDDAIRLFPLSKNLVELNIRGYLGTPLRNSEGRVFGILCALSRSPLTPTPTIQEIMDIIAVKAAAEMERLQIERTLRENQRMLAEAMDLAHLVNWEYDIRTDMLTFDDRFHALYGTTAVCESGNQMPAEVYVREFVHPEDRDILAEEAEKAKKTTDPQYVSQREHRILRRDGEIRHVVMRLAVTKDAEGRTIKIYGVNQDITERKRAEEALRESEVLFRGVFDNANDAVFLVERARDGPGKYRLVNNTAVQMLGYSKEELLEMSPRDIVPEDIAKKIMPEAIKKLVLDGHATFESGNRRKDGSIFPIEVSIRSFRYKGKDIDLSIVRDTTERKRAEEALHMANSKLQLLSAITPHDILNQIFVVKAYCIQSEKIIQDNQKALDYLMRIRKVTEKIQQTISFTKDYEKLGLTRSVWQEMGKISKMAAVDLLPESVNLIVNTGRYEVFADPMLMLVFYNLFENANRHGVHVTEIAVHFLEEKNSGTLIVEDNGIGIPAPLKEKIFEKGFGANTGFGLFLIREILGITGLSIKETGTEGKGARFEIHLPPGTWRRGTV
jgi:PAS domain S-box-containing protein